MSDFHFLAPHWLLALLPLALLLWAAWRADAGGSVWRRVIDPRLLAVLRVGGGGRARMRALALLALGWVIAVIALANPTFERKPVPAFRTDAARVVVLDLSRSMLAEDLTPSRLERARYKVADILARSADGQAGLVAFAGDAFAVAPLTDDADTIRGMLEALSPQIMPVQGSRPDLGIRLGLDLLRQAGARHGEIVLLTDDAGGARARAAAEALRAAGHTLAVIGVGTRDGAPVPGVTRSDGPVIAKLDGAALEALAGTGAGRYATLTSGDDDLDQVLREPGNRPRAVTAKDPMLAERWYELGPWVVLVLLPLAALAFRRGWVAALVLALGPGAMVAPQPAQALGWDDLWQRADQQAASAFAAGELERARELARAPARVGSAAYRLGDYQEAAEQFAAGAQAVDHYNRGNALARSGQLREAIAAYDQALALDPGLDDAEYNRAQVEAALREQEREQPGQQGGDAQRSDANSGDSGGSADADPSSSPDNGQADESDSQGADQQPSEQGGNGQQGQDGQAGQGEQGAEQPGPDPESPGQQGDGAADEGGASEPRSASGADAGPGDGAPPPGSGQRAGAGDDGQPGTSGDGAEPAAASGSERAEAERAAADYRDEATAAAASDAAAATAEPGDEDATGAGGPLAGLDAEARETRQATEQWLRRIPDDPAALLRRKFLYQYQGRQDSAEALNVDEPW